MLITVASLQGCDQPSKELQDKVDALDRRISKLEGAQMQLSTRVGVVEGQATKLETSQSLRDMIDQFKGVAYLSPGSEGYEVIEFSLGTLAVSLEDIRPYANGSRVILDFGNPTSAMVTGISMNLEWGKSASDAATTKTRQLTLTENLRGGAWTKIPVVLEGVPPTDLGFVRVKDFKNGGVSLMKDLRQ
jgi:hypothetical protein